MTIHFPPASRPIHLIRSTVALAALAAAVAALWATGLPRSVLGRREAPGPAAPRGIEAAPAPHGPDLPGPRHDAFGAPMYGLTGPLPEVMVTADAPAVPLAPAEMPDALRSYVSPPMDRIDSALWDGPAHAVTPSTSSTSVPEPATASLLAAGVAVWLARPRRRS